MLEIKNRHLTWGGPKYVSFWILKMNQQLNGVWMKWYLLYFSTKILFFKFFLLIIFAIKMLFQNTIISNFCLKYTFTMLKFHAGFEIKLPLVANSLLKEIETITWMRDEDPALEFEKILPFSWKIYFLLFWKHE